MASRSRGRLGVSSYFRSAAFILPNFMSRFGRGKRENHLGQGQIQDVAKLLPGGCLTNLRGKHQIPRVGNRIFLFGGTSPYHGPPLYFTPEQLALLPHQEEDQTSKVKVIGYLHLCFFYWKKNLRNMISHMALRFSWWITMTSTFWIWLPPLRLLPWWLSTSMGSAQRCLKCLHESRIMTHIHFTIFLEQFCVFLNKAQI